MIRESKRLVAVVDLLRVVNIDRFQIVHVKLEENKVGNKLTNANDFSMIFNHSYLHWAVVHLAHRLNFDVVSV